MLPAPVLTVSTIGDLIDCAYTMWAVCEACGCRRVDLAVLAARYGREASYIRGETPIRIRCAQCGARCERLIIGAR